MPLGTKYERLSSRAVEDLTAEQKVSIFNYMAGYHDSFWPTMVDDMFFKLVAAKLEENNDKP